MIEESEKSKGKNSFKKIILSALASQFVKTAIAITIKVAKIIFEED